MRNTFKLLGIALMVGGWLCAGLGFTLNLPDPVNTTMFVGGLIIGFVGMITLGIIVLKN